MNQNKLQQLYSLRKNFTVIGLTGRVGSGCSQIANALSNKDFIDKVKYNSKSFEESLKPEDIKYKICADYLSFEGNYKPFHVISYKDVLLLHLLHYGSINSNDIIQAIDKIIDIIFQNGEKGKISQTLISNLKKEGFTNRFDKEIDSELQIKIKEYLMKDELWYSTFNNRKDKLKEFLKSKRDCRKIYDFYYTFFESFSKGFFEVLNEYNIVKKTRLVHDLANNLREHGTVENLVLVKENEKTLEHIYIVAETVNQLIKLYRSINNEAKIIIDSLKNSLELMYFKEKFGAFYMIASNKSFEERKLHIKNQLINSSC
ncbi:Deoxycytidylate deaminase [Flavobacterium columnare ATCC 49512]|uniref:Deoxycytidylate deaminase n=1 Tax=Flavobacterium columnare (strain ATCC 49512 / CIP 103533 / TG 44/87) TaxID=1041826 RepID=G8XB46_FLACA|nr:hypothetical protein [Flavobacterium columnare]AEW86014.1 Deoxycytidylate deaminase [Flavobacterium columnare ATCC 49512]